MLTEAKLRAAMVPTFFLLIVGFLLILGKKIFLTGGGKIRSCYVAASLEKAPYRRLRHTMKRYFTHRRLSSLSHHQSVNPRKYSIKSRRFIKNTRTLRTRPKKPLYSLNSQTVAGLLHYLEKKGLSGATAT